MSSRNQGVIQLTAAAKAGKSERSVRRIEKREITAGGRTKRTWRSRKDPFAGVWEDEMVPMLEQNADLQPLTLFEHLNKKYPGAYPNLKIAVDDGIKVMGQGEYEVEITGG